MTRLFRSKSCTLPGIITHTNSSNSPPELSGEPHKSTFSPALYQYDTEDEEDDENTIEEEEGEEENTEHLSLRRKKNNNNSNDSERSPVITSFNFIGEVKKGRRRGTQNNLVMNNPPHHPLLAIVLTALRKSLLVTCSVERDDDVTNHLDIGWPTDVCHVSHVTFDRFNGFLGLPLELQYDLPFKVPSASASVFGVSAQSMHCSYDNRGNCVPTVLLTMQNRLYAEGGLQAEGIFRINADNSQEENVRNQLNRGVLLYGIDVHCLAGLIKAWFRELPTGILDSLTPEQVMHCNTEEECTQLVKFIPSTEAALLDWAINLMADIVLHEHCNKMNARNLAMVFAPNMTQMADPLTALIHAVQVMNFLKTLVNKTLREREESDSRICLSSSMARSPNYKGEHSPDLGVTVQYKQADDCHCSEGSHDSKLSSDQTLNTREKWSFGVISNSRKVTESFTDRISPIECERQTLESTFRDGFDDDELDDDHCSEGSDASKLSSDQTLNRLESDTREKWRFGFNSNACSKVTESFTDRISSIQCKRRTLESTFRDEYDDEELDEGILDKLSLRRGVRKLCKHPVFQLSKQIKKKPDM